MVRAAIIGLGGWGQGLVASVQGKSDAIVFTAAVTRTPARAEAFCRGHGIALGADYDAVLADSAVDAVVIATPHTQHARQIAAAAAAGKHVFTEKPFTLNRADAEGAVAACERAKVTLALGHNRRFLPSMRALKALIADGGLGVVLHAEADMSSALGRRQGTWRASRAESPAGGMTSLGIHAVDALINLCGPIAEVDAVSRRRAIAFDIDDATAALLEFAAGHSGYLATMASGAAIWHVRVFGEKGYGELRGMNQLVHVTADGHETVKSFPETDSLRAELEAFATAAGGGAPYPISPAEMVNGVAVLEAVIGSAASRKPIRIL